MMAALKSSVSPLWRTRRRMLRCVGTCLNLFSPLSSTVDAAEKSKFALTLSEWWDTTSSLSKALHSMNAVRVPMIRDAVLERRGGGGGIDMMRPLAGCSVLDVGCGAGILSEPLARLGAVVTGIDPVESSITTAEEHARSDSAIAGRISYRCCSTEELLTECDVTFDCVVASEVVEHVTEKELFIQQLSQLVKPGGVAAFTTINRTLSSYMLAILAAEQVLRILPTGTHEWNKFISPSELSALLERVGMETRLSRGLSYNPFTNYWTTCDNESVNYFLKATKPL